jgi:cytoskeletal protein CcmA (bactofilin family)
VPLKADTVSVACPRCGHKQPEPRAAYSCICKKCFAHFRVNEVLKPPPQPPHTTIPQKRVVCFQCGAELDVPVSATSTMCKWCSSYLDLGDYHIIQSISKNFRTYGCLFLEEKGYLLNTDSLVGDAVLKGRLIGKLAARRTLEIHSSAHIKGSFTAAQLIIPAGQHFRWPEVLRVGGAEIGGELVAHLRATGTVQLKSTARVFGDVEAGHFIVENGAVFVGGAKIGIKT